MKPITTSWGLIIDPTKVDKVSQVMPYENGFTFKITNNDGSVFNSIYATEQIAFDALIELLGAIAVYKYKKKERPVTVALWSAIIINAILAAIDLFAKHYIH